jgi:hypothetical protein
MKLWPLNFLSKLEMKQDRHYIYMKLWPQIKNSGPTKTQVNLHTTLHSFYLIRHGQSEHKTLGGYSGLSAYHGVNYARKLGELEGEGGGGGGGEN